MNSSERAKYYKYERILSDWYGGREAGLVSAAQVNPERVDTVLERLSKKWDLQRGATIQNAYLIWADIVGPALARHTTPIGFRGQALLVSYDHAAFLRELLKNKSRIHDHIKELLGNDFSTEICFVPRGS